MFGPYGISNVISQGSQTVSRMQSGYLYHYAFVMLMGVSSFVAFVGLWHIFGQYVDARLYFIFAIPVPKPVISKASSSISNSILDIKFALLKSSLESAKIMTYKALWIKEQSNSIHMEPSISKILATEINIKIHDFAFELLNTKSIYINNNNKDYFAERIIKNRLFFVSGGILGGTTEIQKNIIAQRGLGLPK